MSEKDTIEINSSTQDKINDTIDKSQEKVNKAIDSGKEKVDAKIDENKDKINDTIEKGQNIADKVASDFSKGVDEFFVNVKSAQKKINDKVNDYKKSIVQSLDIDLIEDDENYYIRVATPGVNKEDVEIEAGNDEITIEADFPSFIDEIETDEDAQVLIEELKVGKCVKSITFANEIDIHAIKAVFNQGNITITVPKVQIPKTKINVE